MLPNEYENANFTFITRFEKKDENTKKLNVAQYFKTLTFSSLPTVNILPISKIYKNIPYYTFPDKNYWTVIQITPDKSWVDEVTFFSIAMWNA